MSDEDQDVAEGVATPDDGIEVLDEADSDVEQASLGADTFNGDAADFDAEGC